MLKTDLKDEIIVKTKDGDFKLLKKGKLKELPSGELLVPQDDLIISKAKEGRPTASFYFDVDDEHEIRKLSSRQDDDKNRAIKEFIEQTVKHIVVEAGLGETALQNLQLKNIIISRLKDVRTLAETREALLRQGFGGQVISKEQVVNLLNLVEQKRGQVEEVIRTGRVPKAQQINKSKYQEISPLRAQALERVDKPKEVKTETKKVDLTGVKYERKPEVVRGDELTQHVITGPIEEIKNLTLKDFRRLGASPKEAAEKVLQKIDLLGDESLIKRAEGIKAWHDSEVYQVYLEIGAKSMAEKKPVEKVIHEYREADKPYLSPEEFNEVADLNRKLSY